MSGLGYIDARCFQCFTSDIKDHTKDKFNTLAYQGKGIHKCSNCGEILDLSRNTYNIRIKATVDPDCATDPKPWIDFEIIEPFDSRIVDHVAKDEYDPKKPQEINKKLLLEEMHENQEEWWDNSSGIFDVELYYCWSSSGYYMVEWDLDMIALKKTTIDSDTLRTDQE
jgi:hypothetical protein